MRTPVIGTKNAPETLVIELDPAKLYLAGLAPNGRRGMLGKLRRVAALLGYSEPSAVRWPEIRYEHVVAIRSRLAETRSPATVNATLSALRGVSREAWRLG